MPATKNRALRITLLALGLVTLAGCASQAGNNVRSSAGVAGGSELTPELNSYLSSAVAGAVTLPYSPWGNDVTVMADTPYFAASGRTCRELEVTLNNGITQQHIACKTGNTWAQVRPVTRLLNR
ncbi:DVU3141 family protein [Zobellella sp. DQSA1]|uniref:DVU3141 family protein n=1 Tax=Zobellella sp. DQSA1 TaxID=3342386 RepID=UPI0035C22E59